MICVIFVLHAIAFYLLKCFEQSLTWRSLVERRVWTSSKGAWLSVGSSKNSTFWPKIGNFQCVHGLGVKINVKKKTHLFWHLNHAAQEAFSFHITDTILPLDRVRKVTRLTSTVTVTSPKICTSYRYRYFLPKSN